LRRLGEASGGQPPGNFGTTGNAISGISSPGQPGVALAALAALGGRSTARLAAGSSRCGSRQPNAAVVHCLCEAP